MRRLWLHIGSHKTGTSTLQRNLRRAKNHGDLGPYSYLHFRGHYQANPIIEITGQGADMQAAVRHDLVERLIGRDERDAILSTEMLFWLYEPDSIVALAEQLKARFDHIHVVAYLRRQEALALSHRKQVVLGRAALNFYGCQVQALPDYAPYMDRYFDYAAKLRLWEAAFGAEAMCVRKCEAPSLVGGDTVADFFSLIGVELKTRIEDVNAALPRSAALAGLWLQQKGYRRAAFEAVLQEIEDPEKLLPARREAAAFLAHFEDSNTALAARYGTDDVPLYFDMSLAKYPEVGTDSLADLTVDLGALEARVKAMGSDR